MKPETKKIPIEIVEYNKPDREARIARGMDLLVKFLLGEHQRKNKNLLTTSQRECKLK